MNSALLELDLDPQDRVMSEEEQHLQATIPGVRPLRSSPSRSAPTDELEATASEASSVSQAKVTFNAIQMPSTS